MSTMTLDYKKVAKRLIAFVSESDFKLVETLAHRTALLILEEFSARMGALVGQQARRDPRIERRRRRGDAYSRRSPEVV